MTNDIQGSVVIARVVVQIKLVYSHPIASTLLPSFKNWPLLKCGFITKKYGTS